MDSNALFPNGSHGNIIVKPEEMPTLVEPRRPTVNYTLPDGTIVPIYLDVCGGAQFIDFQMKGGRIVWAVRCDGAT